MKNKYGQEEIINDVIYAPFMASNLISFGQFLDKYYTMKLENKEWEVIDANAKLILKSTLSNNMIFKVMINVIDDKCLA